MAQFLFQPWDMPTSKDETFQVFSIRCLKCFNIYRKSSTKRLGRLLNFGGLWGTLIREGRLLEGDAYLIS